MYKQICMMLLLSVLSFSFYGQTNLSKATLSDIGKSKILNPEGKTPFPYNHSIDKGIADKNGDLWFATSDGIYRYDGKLFKNYRVMDGLRVDHVSKMMEDKKGHIWFGAHGGIVRYDPSASSGKGALSFTGIKIRAANGKFLADIDENSGNAEARSTVTQMIEDRHGAIWFSIGYNIYRTDGRSPVALTTGVGNFLKSEKVQYHCTYPDDFGICGIYEDKQGNILISTVACSCGPNITYRLDASRTDHPCLLNTCKHDLLKSQDYAAHYKEVAASFIKITNEDGNSNIAFSVALEDRSGNVWIGSDSGVYKYDGIHFIHFTKKDLLSKSVVNTIYEDTKGNVWFGTEESANFKGNGVFRYDPSISSTAGATAIIQFTTKDGLCNNGPFKNDIISSITEDDSGKLWVTGDGGASYYDGKGFISFTQKDGFTEQPVKSMVKDKSGNIWLGTWALGLYRYDGRSLVCFTENK